MNQFPLVASARVSDLFQHLPRNITRLRPIGSVKGDPNIEYLVRNVLPAQGVAAIYGPSGSGKSFLAIDLAFHVAVGKPSWFLRPSKRAPVVYVALEGQAGIKKRTLAWEQYNRVTLTDEVQIMSGPFRLDDPAAVDDLAADALATVGPGCVIVIDTLAQAMAGFDENSSADMGAAISGAQQLSEKVKGLVLLIHHTGKDKSKGLRGHSSLLGALDAAIEVSAEKSTGRKWKIQKSKDDEAGQEFDFELVSCAVGVDEDGDDITSCAVRQALHIPQVSVAALKGSDRLPAMAAIRQHLAGSGPSLTEADAVSAVAAVLGCEPRRRKNRALSTIKGLIGSGHLRRDEQGRIIDATAQNSKSIPTEPP